MTSMKVVRCAKYMLKIAKRTKTNKTMLEFGPKIGFHTCGFVDGFQFGLHLFIWYMEL
jgi:hypothetical protein